MTAYYKVNFSGKYEGYMILKTLTPGIEKIFDDQFVSSYRSDITNIELLCEDYEDGKALQEVIADLFDEISSMGVSARRFLRDDTLSYYDASWPQIEALRSLSNSIEKNLERAKLLLECLSGWELTPTLDKPADIMEKLHEVSRIHAADGT